MKRIVLAILFIVGSCPAAPAHDYSSVVSYLKAVTPNLINFIQNHTSYIYDGWQYPDILIETEEEICSVIYEDKRTECDIAGYYNDIDNSIHIVDGPTDHMVEDRFFEVVLVHELVHFLQYHNGTYETIACKQALEEDAFFVQTMFVETQNINPENAPDPLFSLLVSRCLDQRPFMYADPEIR